MSETNLLNVVLWIVQGFLALFFLAAGAPKVSGRGLDRWIGFSDLPRPLTIFIGVAELLGAAGLVLPMATGILPWLTPLAALGLATTVLMATGFHLRADERLPALETALWSSILGVVAIGRWNQVASHANLSGWALIAALVVLVPSVITNLVVLLRRPVKGGAPRPVSASLPLPGRPEERERVKSYRRE
jgi:DoxX-like family